MRPGTAPPPFESAEQTILDDPGGRNIKSLFRPGHLESACRALAAAKRIGIVTGFYVPSAAACETDGPLGAAHLATTLRAHAQVVVGTDRWCLPQVKALIPDADDDPDSLQNCDVFVAIERLGRAADGRYYSMRGLDLTAWTEPLDQLFVDRPAGVTTIGVGDGGNEIGMGCVQDDVRRSISGGATIACVVPADHLVVAGVSNWGAWALAAGVDHLRGTSTGPSFAEAFANLRTLVAAGAVDGVTGRNEPTVDGLSWAIHEQTLGSLYLLDFSVRGNRT